MRPDAKAVAAGCPKATIKTANHLCRSEIGVFEDLARRSTALTVACTQEAPLFADIAEDAELAVSLRFVNIREQAGWSKDGAKAGPKMAALVAVSALDQAPITPATLTSEGVALVLGRDQVALDAAHALFDKLNITLLLTDLSAVSPPRENKFPIRQGRVANASGWLGAFTVKIDAYREPAASSRSAFVVGPARNGLESNCDILIDLTGGQPLFPASDLRPGYFRADPASPAQVAEMLLKASDAVGTFDKVKYIDFKPDLCAHSRSKITGCTRCLDLCPTGAITPAGDHVAISAEICAGCGACAAACPTGAATYTLPQPDALATRLRTMLQAYTTAGGRDAELLFHDKEHGEPMIDMLARFGNGLPAAVIPVQVNETTQIGLETFMAAFAYGAARVHVLNRAKPKHDIAGLHRQAEYANTILASQGYGNGVSVLELDDPDQLGAALSQPRQTTPSKKPSGFVAVGGKRDQLVLGLREVHAAAPTPSPVVAMPASAPFGRVNVNAEGCTLCLSCVSACPVSALGDNPDRPMLTFDESLCVQCGLCAATCPENVITLEPRVNFEAYGAPRVTLKAEEPAHCTACGTAFGVKSTIDRIAAKLEGKHWMYSGQNADRLRVLRMCENCRVGEMTKGSFDPYGAPERAAPKTTDDYIREREEIDKLRAENKGKLQS
jgi:ferredoxin